MELIKKQFWNYLKATKQITKKMDVTWLIERKSIDTDKKARPLARKYDLETAKQHVETGVKYCHEIRRIFYDFLKANSAD